MPLVREGARSPSSVSASVESTSTRSWSSGRDPRPLRRSKFPPRRARRPRCRSCLDVVIAHDQHRRRRRNLDAVRVNRDDARLEPRSDSHQRARHRVWPDLTVIRFTYSGDSTIDTSPKVIRCSWASWGAFTNDTPSWPVATSSPFKRTASGSSFPNRRVLLVDDLEVGGLAIEQAADEAPEQLGEPHERLTMFDTSPAATFTAKGTKSPPAPAGPARDRHAGLVLGFGG